MLLVRVRVCVRVHRPRIYIYIYIRRAGTRCARNEIVVTTLISTNNIQSIPSHEYSKFFLRVLRSSISNFSFFFPFFLQFYHSTRHFTTEKIKIFDFYLEKLYLASSYRSFNLQNVPLPRCPSPLLFPLIGRGNTTSFNRHIPFLPKRCSFCFVFDSREN